MNTTIIAILAAVLSGIAAFLFGRSSRKPQPRPPIRPLPELPKHEVTKDVEEINQLADDLESIGVGAKDLRARLLRNIEESKSLAGGLPTDGNGGD